MGGVALRRPSRLGQWGGVILVRGVGAMARALTARAEEEGTTAVLVVKVVPVLDIRPRHSSGRVDLATVGEVVTMELGLEVATAGGVVLGMVGLGLGMDLDLDLDTEAKPHPPPHPRRYPGEDPHQAPGWACRVDRE